MLLDTQDVANRQIIIKLLIVIMGSITITCSGCDIPTVSVSSDNQAELYNDWQKINISQDPSQRAKGQKLIEELAKSGYLPAIYALGDAYYEGNSVVRDFVLSRVWFEQAARVGDVASMSRLARMLRLGLGGPRDFVSAYAWYDVATAIQAASRTRTDVMAERHALYQLLTPAERSRAQTQAKSILLLIQNVAK